MDLKKWREKKKEHEKKIHSGPFMVLLQICRHCLWHRMVCQDGWRFLLVYTFWGSEEYFWDIKVGLGSRKSRWEWKKRNAGTSLEHRNDGKTDRRHQGFWVSTKMKGQSLAPVKARQNAELCTKDRRFLVDEIAGYCGWRYAVPLCIVANFSRHIPIFGSKAA